MYIFLALASSEGAVQKPSPLCCGWSDDVSLFDGTATPLQLTFVVREGTDGLASIKDTRREAALSRNFLRGDTWRYCCTLWDLGSTDLLYLFSYCSC